MSIRHILLVQVYSLSTQTTTCTTIIHFYQVIMESPILVEYPKKGIVKITFNHPTALNAININLLRELVKALHTHQEAQVIVLEGAGESR